MVELSMDIAAFGARAAQLEREGRFAEAEAVLNTILAAHPGHAIASYALGILKLRQGDYAAGWPLYEARVYVGEKARPKPRLSFPEWRGEDVGSLLILPEQGHGDMMQFVRYVPELRKRGVRVTLGCQPALARLFGHLDAKILPIDGAVTLERHDAWVLAGSLPGLFPTIPPAEYLPGPGPGGGGIGVVIKGDPKNLGNHERSLPPDLGAWLLEQGRDLAPEATGARDFEDTRQIIEGLDEVITICTSVVHLAGSMGKRTTLLLPHVADWRWGVSGETTPWYRSVRILRQPSPGDWRPVLAALGRGTPP